MLGTWHAGQLLYERLKQAVEGPIALTTQRSGCSGPPLQLIFALLVDHPFSIDDWSQWDRLHRRLHPSHKQVSPCSGMQDVAQRMSKAARWTTAHVRAEWR